MISKEFEATLGEALREARERRHEYLCNEHVLFAMLRDRRGAEILRACGGNLAHLDRQLEAFFTAVLEVLPPGEENIRGRQPSSSAGAGLPACPVLGQRRWTRGYSGGDDGGGRFPRGVDPAGGFRGWTC